MLTKLFAPIQVVEKECPPNDLPPEVPSHPAVTRRAQFRIKKKIKDEKAAKKGKGKGGPQAIARKKAKERELVVPKEKARERRERRPRRKVLARTSATTE